MTRNKTYLLTLILSGAAWVCPGLTGQTSFVYEKGKMFTDVTAFQMEHSIGLGTQQIPVYYEKNIPGKQQTVSYRIEIPTYKRGIFFSRDSRRAITNGQTIRIGYYPGYSTDWMI